MSVAIHDAPWPAAYWAALAQVLVAALPLVLARGFYYDWGVHVWFANHIASGIVAELRNLCSSSATSVIGWILLGSAAGFWTLAAMVAIAAIVRSHRVAARPPGAELPGARDRCVALGIVSPRSMMRSGAICA